MDLLSVLQSSFADYFRLRLQERIHELVEPLSSEQLWQRPFPYGNSMGNLILHLTGNLNYYIGAQIAGTGYIRHRDLEFSDSGKAKDPLLKAFDDAIATTVSAVFAQSDSRLGSPIPCRSRRRLDPVRAVSGLRRPCVSPRRPDHLFAKGTSEAALGDQLFLCGFLRVGELWLRKPAAWLLTWPS